MPIIGTIASSRLTSTPSVESFDSISTTTLGSSQTTLEINSIPGTYQHLQIRGILKSTAISGGTPRFYFNGDRSLSYQMHTITGNGSSAYADQATSQDSIYAGYGSQTTAQWGAYVINIFDYASTTKSKTVQFLHGYDSNSSGWITFSTGMWTSTNAITSFAITPQQVASFTAGSTLALYGIKA